jgi:hypothetical protein
MRRDGDGGEGGQPCERADLAQQPVSVLPGQRDVAHENVGPSGHRAQTAEGGARGLGDGDDGAAVLEHTADDVARVWIVLHEHHVQPVQRHQAAVLDGAVERERGAGLGDLATRTLAEAFARPAPHVGRPRGPGRTRDARGTEPEGDGRQITLHCEMGLTMADRHRP